MNKTTLCIFILAMTQVLSTYTHKHPIVDDECEHSHEESGQKCCMDTKKEVCGKSGLTYLNKCFLKRNKEDAFKHEGCCHHPAPVR